MLQQREVFSAYGVTKKRDMINSRKYEFILDIKYS